MQECFFQVFDAEFQSPYKEIALCGLSVGDTDNG